jgi:triosephosphate isomerase (TIM)
MRRPIMAGNWKMFKTIAETCAFFEKFRPLVSASTHCDIVICPSFVSLAAAAAATQGTRIRIGAQNMYWANEGAYTGETCASMLKDVGCEWVLIAHSERRQYFGETDETARKKIVAAIEAGLTPVYCVGETLEQRQSNNTNEVLDLQFLGGTEGLTAEQFARIAMAYEPVWAIGTGKVATPEIAADAHRFIRGRIKHKFGADAAAECRILYGGSVKPDNVRGLMAHPDLDGALVGGASLDPAALAAIVNF